MYINVYRSIYIYIYVYSHINAHVYIYIRIYIYTCTYAGLVSPVTVDRFHVDNSHICVYT